MSARQGGFSLIELMIALALLSVLSINAVNLLQTANKVTDESSVDLEVERLAHQTLDRIAFALMGADLDSLAPIAASPLYSDAVDFSVSLGVQDGVVVWGDGESIFLDPAGERVIWSQDDEAGEELRRVVWCSFAQPFLEGESPNGADDNMNLLVDERGLTFVVEGRRVRIDLTLGRKTSSGDVVQCTYSTEVTCRN